MLRIGIDFDNTIACYDRSFPDVAEMMGLAEHAACSSKGGVKAQVLGRPGGDLDWQRLQGQVYGKHMLRAEMFPGFLEFLHLSRLRGHEVFIVSHKSEFGHFDPDRVPLRSQALLWMQANAIFDDEVRGLCLTREEVFFEATREEKIQRIRELGCTHFVDDLPEVFADSEFPATVERILFRAGPASNLLGVRTVASWRELTEAMYGAGTEAEICRVVQARFPALGIDRVELRKGRGNSRVYELIAEPGRSYALKVYPDRQLDPRPRRATEFLACRELHERGYPVCEAFHADANLDWGIFGWVAGTAISAPDSNFVAEALGFVGRLYRDSRNGKAFGDFGPASEACLSGKEIERQLRARLDRLMQVDAAELRDFLVGEFEPQLSAIVLCSRQECGELFDSELPRGKQMPSPSDFGAHNALRVEGSRSVFIDFEYFGWDDPVKLVSDFYWHPGMRLARAERAQWFAGTAGIFREDASFALRLGSYLPLFGLRWCLILLNEFLHHGAKSRSHANPQKAGNMASIRSQQLEKSKQLLREIKEAVHGHGSAIQVS